MIFIHNIQIYTQQNRNCATSIDRLSRNECIEDDSMGKLEFYSKYTESKYLHKTKSATRDKSSVSLPQIWFRIQYECNVSKWSCS